MKKAITEHFTHLLFIFICLLSFVPLLSPVNREWAYDDKAVFENNEFVQTSNFQAIWSLPYWAGTQNHYQLDNLYRPFFLSLMAMLWGHDNLIRWLVILFHLGIGILLYHVLSTSFVSLAVSQEDKKYARLLALFGFAFFLFHPLNVEVTAQAVGLLEIMPALLGFTSLFLLPSHPGIALFLAALAPGWKETGYLWLGALALLFFFRKKFIYASLTCVTGLFWLGLRYGIYGRLFSSNNTSYVLLNPLVGMPIWDGFISRIAILGHYLRLYFLPFPLSCDYSLGTLPLPGYAIQLWVLPALGFLYFIFIKRRILLTFDRRLSWIPLLTLLPVLHLMNAGGVVFAERFAYAFTAGLTLLLLPFIYRFFARQTPLVQRTLLALGAGLLTLHYISWLNRHAVWVSSETLFATDSRVFPYNAKLRFNYGVALGGKEKWPEALHELSTSINLFPNFPEAHLRIGQVYSKMGDDKKAQLHWGIASSLGVPIPFVKEKK